MEFWKEVKKEWTWKSIVSQWPDYVSVFIAGCVAYQYYRPFWKFLLVWLIAFCLSRFIIISITKLIKKS